MMNSEEHADASAVPETSGPAPPASFTDLQTTQTETPCDDNYPHLEAASNTDRVESFSHPRFHQLNAGDQEQVRCHIDDTCI